MGLRRLLRHLASPRWWILRKFRHGTVKAIKDAIADSERQHRGELRFVVEGRLPVAYLLRNASARDRAIDLFSQMRIWDTVENTGVLIYVQLADRCVEIVADRGIAARIPQAEWDEICRDISVAYRNADYKDGAMRAIARAGKLLGSHFPARDRNPNELPDAPVLL